MTTPAERKDALHDGKGEDDTDATRPWNLARSVAECSAEEVEVLKMRPGDFSVLMQQMKVPALSFDSLRDERALAETARLYALPEAVAARKEAAEAAEAARQKAADAAVVARLKAAEEAEEAEKKRLYELPEAEAARRRSARHTLAWVRLEARAFWSN